MTFKHRRTALLAIAMTAMGVAASPALAYVGPGAGLTLLGALWGLIVAVVVSLGFVLLWPIRRLMRRNKQAGRTPDTEASVDDPSHSMLTNPSGDRDQRQL
jgi:hypothetical protein